MTSLGWKVKVQNDIAAFSAGIFFVAIVRFCLFLFFWFFFFNTTNVLYDPSNWDFLLFNKPGSIILQSES